jgi:hypothetical protein
LVNLPPIATSKCFSWQVKPRQSAENKAPFKIIPVGYHLAHFVLRIFDQKGDKFPLDSGEKLARVECQIRQAMLGNLLSIACPYCLSNVVLGAQTLCCGPMGDATDTVLHRLEKEVLRETDDFAIYASELQSTTEAFENEMRPDASNATQSIQ